MPTFLEFFAGGGMARAGLGEKWKCVFSNDIDAKKSSVYQKNWGSVGHRLADVGTLTIKDLPSRSDLAWASFPCQDLSLAGCGAGLSGTRSGTFWSFWSLIDDLASNGRAPRIVVIENVCGLLNSNHGADFAAVCAAITGSGYDIGALVVDASMFVPQSRPRLFLIGVKRGTVVPPALIRTCPSKPWHNSTIQKVVAQLDQKVAKNWIWWNLPIPASRSLSLSDVIEDEPKSVIWHSKFETQRLLEMMTDVNLAKVNEMKSLGKRSVGAVYKRTRSDATGRRWQRAEVRFDLAGCLRTPGGGSSRQLILLVEKEVVKSRLISPRETARLMGLPDDYRLPDNNNEAYHLTGDGVVVPVVSHISKWILEPILSKAADRIAVSSRLPTEQLSLFAK